jgi:NADH dehydrogenase FAD-containing subunit
MAEVLAAVTDGSEAPMSWIQGHVTKISDGKAEVRRSDGSKEQVHFDYALVGTGSRCGWWKAMAPATDQAAAIDDWGGRLVARRAQMAKEIERLKAAEQACIAEKEAGATAPKTRVAVIGAGLVGVELVAEIAEGYPGLRGSVMLCDLAPEILPALPQTQAYCREWLQEHGVQIVTGPDAAGAADDPDIIRYMCVGNKPVVPEFDPPVSLDAAGHVQVNTALQVMHAEVPKEDGVLPESIREVWGAGKVFALGDCCEVKELPRAFSKTIYPAEALSSIVVQNILAGVTRAHASSRRIARVRELALDPVVCSLGSKDAIMTLNGKPVLTGTAAAGVKKVIEKSKLSENRGGMWGTILWKYAPHF